MKKSFAVLIILALIFLGCGGKDKVKPSADSILTTESLNSINIIKTAYQERDGSILQSRLDPVLAKDILKELIFEKAELSFTPRMVRINNSTVMVNLNWQGTWVIKDNSIRNRGVTVFVFEGSPMKLMRIDGDNPFHTPLTEK